MSSKRILLSLFTLLAFGWTAQAQESDVHISYDIEFITEDSDSPEMAMLNGSTMILAFKDQHVAMNMQMGQFMSIDVAMDGEKQTGTMLMSMMGTNMAANVSQEEYMQLEKENGEVSTQVEKMPGKKKILDYNCKRAKITSEDGSIVMVWYTDKIKPQNLNSDMTSMYGDLDGFPLEMEVMANDTPMVMTAKEIRDAKSSDFEVEIPEGTEIMTFTELKQMGGN